MVHRNHLIDGKCLQLAFVKMKVPKIFKNSKVRSMYSGSVENDLCVASHAFTLHILAGGGGGAEKALCFR